MEYTEHTQSIRAGLAAAGLSLPPVSPPRGVYVPAVVNGRLVQVSGQLPVVDGELAATGLVGGAVPPAEARELSRRCALAALAAVDAVVGPGRTVRAVRLVGYVASDPGFTGQAAVVEGATDLLATVLGEAGHPAVSPVGVPSLPLDAPLELELLFELTN
ncbi:RidA family protein [Kitasatospora sp. NPDC002227]|uniref:RidA family protein n=1 Tax=Kitasatospora sp. NPDC002227 TaxID=3154773 RepID=UPI0033212221